MTTTAPTPTPNFRIGDTVRVKKTGLLVELDDVNPNPNYIAEDEIWGEGFRLDGGGSVIIDSADEVETVDLKPIPGVEELAVLVSGRLHHGFDDDVVIVDETSTSGGTVEVLARDKQGVVISFLVTVHQVERASL